MALNLMKKSDRKTNLAKIFVSRRFWQSIH